MLVVLECWMAAAKLTPHDPQSIAPWASPEPALGEVPTWFVAGLIARLVTLAGNLS
jgi:hypothetical protein